jgi:hypothetical protein
VHVVKILPPTWGLPGAIWRLNPSHQPVGALDPPAVTSVSAPNTRSLIYDHCGVGPGARPVLGQVPPEGAGGQVGLGPSRFLAGSDRQHQRGAGGGGGARRRPSGGQKAASKALYCIPGGGMQATDLRPRDWGEPREGCGEARAPIRDT